MVQLRREAGPNQMMVRFDEIKMAVKKGKPELISCEALLRELLFVTVETL